GSSASMLRWFSIRRGTRDACRTKRAFRLTCFELPRAIPAAQITSLRHGYRTGPLELIDRLSFQQRVEQFCECIRRHLAFLLLAVDEEGRRGGDTEFFRRAVMHPVDLVPEVIIPEASVEGLLAHPGLLEESGQGFEGLVRKGPVLLLGEQEIDDCISLVVAGAACQHETGRRQRVEGEFAQNETDLAGVDIFAR